MRILAGACVALAVMCAGLAMAWNAEREQAACWRAAAEFQLQPQGDCRNWQVRSPALPRWDSALH